LSDGPDDNREEQLGPLEVLRIFSVGSVEKAALWTHGICGWKRPAFKGIGQQNCILDCRLFSQEIPIAFIKTDLSHIEKCPSLTSVRNHAGPGKKRYTHKQVLKTL
jgi:hypothetical protein